MPAIMAQVLRADQVSDIVADDGGNFSGWIGTAVWRVLAKNGCKCLTYPGSDGDDSSVLRSA